MYCWEELQDDMKDKFQNMGLLQYLEGFALSCMNNLSNKQELLGLKILLGQNFNTNVSIKLLMRR